MKPRSNIKAGDVLIYHSGTCDSGEEHSVFVTKGSSNRKLFIIEL